MSERGRDIARRWKREIDEEIRRAAAHDRGSGRWRAVPWIALWVVWLVLLLALVVRVNPLD
ncbi:MAG TPA: hypothetical protein VME41_18615 [Stellaceae bacterium]|nr:hypothetical protein [Stellaceae bacterium]